MLCFETEVLTGLYQISTTKKKKFSQNSANKTYILGTHLQNVEIMFITDLAKNTIDEPIYDTRQ